MQLRLSAYFLTILRYAPILRIDPLTVRALSYTLRTTAASLAALYIALALQFDDPQWAAVTVWIVGQPMRGMTLSKSFYRMLGTIVGATMAIVLTAWFAQQGTLFFVFFAGWIALCTYISTLLRNFKSYGAVLAGYTCGIVALSAYGKPDTVFTLAMARVSCIFLGIAVEAAMAVLFVKTVPHNALFLRLRTIASNAAAVIAQTLSDPKNVAEDKAQRILRDIATLDSAVSFASAESADVRHRAGMLRRIIIAVMTAISAAQALGRHFVHAGSVPEALKSDLDRTVALLGKLTPETSLNDSIALGRLRTEIEANGRLRLEQDKALTAREYFVGSRFSETLGALDTALRLTKDFFAGLATRGKVDLSIHRDYEAAAINAVRAYVAVILAWLFWYATGWPSGQSFVRLIAVVCALFASRDNPVLGSRNFFNGTVIAVCVAGLYHMFVLPGIAGFELLALVMAPPLAIGGYLMLQPKTAALASPFNIFFISLLGISNAARYPIQNFLNDIIPPLLGTGISVFVFLILLPVNPVERRKRIQRAVLHDIGMLAEPGNRTTAERWYSRMADRLALLSVIRLPGQEPKLMERIIVAVEIGVQTINLRNLARDQALPEECRRLIRPALDGIRMFPRLDLVPGLGRGLFAGFLPARRSGRDASWLHDLLSGQARQIRTFFEENGEQFPAETRLLILQAIAAQREIAEILVTHYIGRKDAIWQATTGPAPEAKGS